ncbi:MAG: alpha-1,2-fucosyltransferase [Bacillota bacterium]
MIISQITSGLGNQLFQYAAARRLAYVHKVPLKLDLSWFNYCNYREYGLKYFNIVENIASTGEIEDVKRQNHFQERSFSFNPEIKDIKPSVYLSGYWQSEKYFQDIAEIIRREFTLKYQPDESNMQMTGFIQRYESASLHIRRTDYLSNPNHGVVSLEYYHEAVNYLINIIANAHFFIFSDDWQWVRENLRLKYPSTLITLNSAAVGYLDLYLMSLCKHHIIANSTFSWWGAWLSQYPNKIVIVPQKWFHALPYDTRDLIPESWRVM